MTPDAIKDWVDRQNVDFKRFYLEIPPLWQPGMMPTTFKFTRKKGKKRHPSAKGYGRTR